MPFIELQYDEFSDQAIADFWIKLSQLHIPSVKVDLNTETAVITGISEDWSFVSGMDHVGVRLNAYETMIRWDRAAEIVNSDSELENIILPEALLIMDKLKLLKPDSIMSVHYTIDQSQEK